VPCQMPMSSTQMVRLHQMTNVVEVMQSLRRLAKPGAWFIARGFDPAGFADRFRNSDR
jgi:hypothetical protein